MHAYGKKSRQVVLGYGFKNNLIVYVYFIYLVMIVTFVSCTVIWISITKSNYFRFCFSRLHCIYTTSFLE